MAKLLGVGSHQIVSQIEAGDRRLKAEDLLAIVSAVKALGGVGVGRGEILHRFQ